MRATCGLSDQPVNDVSESLTCRAPMRRHARVRLHRHPRRRLDTAGGSQSRRARRAARPRRSTQPARAAFSRRTVPRQTSSRPYASSRRESFACAPSCSASRTGTVASRSGRTLDITPKTVDIYKTRIGQKLGFTHRTTCASRSDSVSLETPAVSKMLTTIRTFADRQGCNRAVSWA